MEIPAGPRDLIVRVNMSTRLRGCRNLYQGSSRAGLMGLPIERWMGDLFRVL